MSREPLSKLNILVLLASRLAFIEGGDARGLSKLAGALRCDKWLRLAGWIGIGKTIFRCLTWSGNMLAFYPDIVSLLLFVNCLPAGLTFFVI